MKTTESAYTHEKGGTLNPKHIRSLIIKKRKLEERKKENPQNVAVAPGDLYKNIFDLTSEEKEKEMKNWNEWGERNRKVVDEHSTESEKRRLLDKMLNLKEDEPKLPLDDLFKSKKKEQETNI